MSAANEPNWTVEQNQVIDSRNQTLLVSAAAGSGKTAVLVQRILDQIMDPEHPVDIDRMLVVTFTNAAASQLREKIRGRLEEEAAGEDPARVQLAQRQMARLSSDHIETIDRFCREVVLDHARSLGIDPSFRIVDEGERKLLRSEVASEIIEESYERGEEDFLSFSSMYAAGKKDDALEELILGFYEFSMSHEFPKLWRHLCAEQYRESDPLSPWRVSMAENVRMTIGELHERVRDALSVCSAQSGPYHYTDTMMDHDDLLTSLEACDDFSRMNEILRDYSWPKPGIKKRGKQAVAVDPGLEEYVKGVHTQGRKTLDTLREKYFFSSEDHIFSLQLETARYMDVLVHLTDEFEQRYSREKENRGIADFSDVAHWALRVLIEEDEDGNPVTGQDGSFLPTMEAKELAEHFEQIYIDEYQDSNPVQEMLLHSVSREAFKSVDTGQPSGYNRFMVGDVKQSIYRFRMADPEIFMQKERTYSTGEDAPERRIDLHMNFRSRGMVLDAVNMIFRQIMRKEVGGVEYTPAQELREGFVFPEDEENEGRTGEELLPELLLAQKGDVPGALNDIETEAQIVAARIRAMTGHTRIYDKKTGTYRSVCYGDITILLRKSRDWAETFSRVLDAQGIPNRADSNTGYFDSAEVRAILAYLSVLDNPRQDIPLAASLRSEIAGVNDTELAKLRTGFADVPLYEAVCAYSVSGGDAVLRKKLALFLERTDALRKLVKDTPIHMLLWRIFDETGYADRMAASEGGRQKMGNLELLVDMAISYEETSYRGLFHFVRYIEKLRKAELDIGKAPEGDSGESLVRIMTMHKSKGLEFPVVFVSGLGKAFNHQDSRSALVLHAGLGAGLDYRNEELRVRTDNRIRSAICDRIESDSIGEELRILYVAMTRAEQKLILSGVVADREKAIVKASASRARKSEKLAGSMVLGCANMMEWILNALVRHEAEAEFFDSARWGIRELEDSPARSLPGAMRVLTGPEVLKGTAKIRQKDQDRLADLVGSDADEVFDRVVRERFDHMLSQHYAFFEGRRGLPVKLSVSELKKAGYEAELARLAGEDPGDSAMQLAQLEDKNHGDEMEIPVPAFMKDDSDKEQISGAGRGTAYHLVLAETDFTKDYRPGQVRELLESMLKCDKIQKNEADGISPERIEIFLRSELADRMRAAARAGGLRKEQPFVIRKRADTIRPEWSSEETVLIQGIIDAFFEEEDHLILIDYKSDRARPGDEESLVKRYRTQFLLYRDALESLLEKKVTQAWLYSLSLNKAIPVEL